MRKIEEFEIHELVRPVFDGFQSDGGSGQMYLSQEYFVKRFLKDARKRFYGPYSSVVIEGRDGLTYCLDYGRPVLSRNEPIPSVQDLATLNPEFWNDRNREVLRSMISEARSDGQIVRTAVSMKSLKRGMDVVIRVFPEAMALTSFPKQARTLVTIICEISVGGKTTQADLEKTLNESYDRFNSRQPAHQIWQFYKSKLVAAGVISIEVGGDDENVPG